MPRTLILETNGPRMTRIERMNTDQSKNLGKSVPSVLSVCYSPARPPAEARELEARISENVAKVLERLE